VNRIFFILLLATQFVRADSLVLTQAVQVLKLSVEEAKSKIPVRLRGVVLTGRDLSAGTAVIGDDTGSIYIYGSPSFASSLLRTNLVEVEGVSDAGEFARRVAVTKVRVLGQGQIPSPRRVAYGELLMGQLDSQWVEVEGCLRSCVYLPEAMPSQLGGMEAELATGGGRLAVEIFDHAANPAWVDGMLVVRGVCFHKFNQKRQFYQMYLCVPEGEPVLLKSPPLALTSLPTNRVENLLQFPIAASFVHRVRVVGVATYQHPGEFFYLYDGERGLLVRTSQEGSLKVGDQVSVAGFPAQGDYSPVLEDASYSILSRNHPLPAPVLIKSPGDTFQHDAELITGRAKLVGFLRQGDGWIYSMQLDNAVFTAQLLKSSDTPIEPKFEIGSELSFTGICSVVLGSLMPKNPLHTPQSFRLLLRSPSDLRLIQPPPWWTAQRILVASTIVVSLLTACVAVIILFSRTRLQRQREARRQAEAEFAAILKERNRMAREIHDTLAQDISGISAQLEVARKKLPSGCDAALNHIDLAHQTARNSLQEARRTIWNIRSQVLEGRDVGTALAELLHNEANAAGIAHEAIFRGETRSLTFSIENDLLRIGQEAIHNATRHAKPKNIKLEMTFTDAAVTFVLRDDGCGFDPEDTSFVRKSHFGLKGMKERAAQNGGELTIHSAPGKGTEILVKLPLT
jgi:signal transduction histidine kinase